MKSKWLALIAGGVILAAPLWLQKLFQIDLPSQTQIIVVGGGFLVMLVSLPLAVRDNPHTMGMQTPIWLIAGLLITVFGCVLRVVCAPIAQ